MIKTWSTPRKQIVRTAPVQRGDVGTCYSNRRWIRYSAQFLSRYPMCVYCACNGVVNHGSDMFRAQSQRNLVVDHVTPHGGDSNLFWDEANLETLCRYPCHDCIKSQHEHARRTAQQWYDVLRRTMHESKSEEFIRAMQQWIPQHVYGQLIAE